MATKISKTHLEKPKCLLHTRNYAYNICPEHKISDKSTRERVGSIDSYLLRCRMHAATFINFPPRTTFPFTPPLSPGVKYPEYSQPQARYMHAIFAERANFVPDCFAHSPLFYIPARGPARQKKLSRMSGNRIFPRPLSRRACVCVGCTCACMCVRARASTHNGNAITAPFSRRVYLGQVASSSRFTVLAGRSGKIEFSKSVGTHCRSICVYVQCTCMRVRAYTRRL